MLTVEVFTMKEMSEGAILGTAELQRCAEGLCGSLCAEGRNSAEGKGMDLWNMAALSVCSLFHVPLALQDTLRSQCSGRDLTSPRPRQCGVPLGHQTRPQPALELIMSPAPGK